MIQSVCSLMACAVLALAAPVLAQSEEDAVKEAFLKNAQAHLDRDLDALRATSTGGPAAMDAVEADMQRRAAMERVSTAAATLPGATTGPARAPASRPAPASAREIWGFTLRRATITIEGDTATIRVPPVAGGAEAPGWVLQKVDGQWKRDLTRGESPYTAEKAAHHRLIAEQLNEVAAMIESGKITTREQFQQEMNERERRLRVRDPQATTRPAK